LGIETIEISLVNVKSEAEMFEYALSDNDQVGFYEDSKLAPLIDLFKDEIDLEAFKVSFDQPFDLEATLASFEAKVARRLVKDTRWNEPKRGTAKTKRGDVFQLGNHRLMCGDSTNSTDVKRLFGKDLMTMHFTSPPYWNQREYSNWERYEDYLDDTKKVMQNVYDFSHDVSVCLWDVAPDIDGRCDIPADHSKLLQSIGFSFRGKIAWIKIKAFGGGQRPCHIRLHRLYYPMFGWEPILIYCKFGYPTFDATDLNTITEEWFKDVWEIHPHTGGGEGQELRHTAPFPLELAERIVRCFSQRGNVVSDLFLGSGTTLMAAEIWGRRCLGMEINPNFCDIIISRYATLFDKSEEDIRKTLRSNNARSRKAKTKDSSS